MANADACMAIDFPEELECAVCLDSWKQPRELLPCGHIYCAGCLPSLLQHECAVCREKIEGSRVPHRTLINMAMNLKVECQLCGWTGKREMSLKHTCTKEAQEARAAQGEQASAAIASRLNSTRRSRRSQPASAAGLGSAVAPGSRLGAAGGGGGGGDGRRAGEPSAPLLTPTVSAPPDPGSGSYNTASVMAYLYSPREPSPQPPHEQPQPQPLAPAAAAPPKMPPQLTSPPLQLPQLPPPNYVDPCLDYTSPKIPGASPEYPPLHRPPPGSPAALVAGASGGCPHPAAPSPPPPQTQQQHGGNAYQPARPLYPTTASGTYPLHHHQQHHHQQHAVPGGGAPRPATKLAGPPPPGAGVNSAMKFLPGAGTGPSPGAAAAAAAAAPGPYGTGCYYQQRPPAPITPSSPHGAVQTLSELNMTPEELREQQQQYLYYQQQHQAAKGGSGGGGNRTPRAGGAGRHCGTGTGAGSPPAGPRPPLQRYEVIEPPPGHPRPWTFYNLTQEEYDQIVSLFVFFDQDESGDLNYAELGRLARWLNFARTQQEVNNIFAAMDYSGSGALSQAEFFTWLKYNKPDPTDLYGLTQAQYNTFMMQFQLYDRDQDGMLNKEDFVRMVLHLGDVRRPEEGEQVFHHIDRRGRGAINLHDRAGSVCGSSVELPERSHRSGRRLYIKNNICKREREREKQIKRATTADVCLDHFTRDPREEANPIKPRAPPHLFLPISLLSKMMRAIAPSTDYFSPPTLLFFIYLLKLCVLFLVEPTEEAATYRFVHSLLLSLVKVQTNKQTNIYIPPPPHTTTTQKPTTPNLDKKIGLP
eukprot:gene11302-7834_t